VNDEQPRRGGITRRGLAKIVSSIGAVVIASKKTTAALAHQVSDALGSVLPFPPVPTASIAGPTLQESRHVRRAEPNHLPPAAPNILIVLLDDVGFGLADTLGGEVHTPTLTRLANEGVAFNQFHTTSICSPTRAALLTGRNHQRVGSGTIAERALDFDGYTGVIPKSAATVAQVLRDYGYKTSAFGKWHNTPATETTAMGPFDRWPTGYGFDYFYGFMAGETSQYEPRLFENNIPIEPPHDPTYHLSRCDGQPPRRQFAVGKCDQTGPRRLLC
jgi:Sulfatase